MRLPLEEVAVLHFSTKQKPSHYALTTGLPDFNQWLEQLFSIRGAEVGSLDPDVRDRIRLGMEEWSGGWDETWREMLKKVQ